MTSTNDLASDLLRGAAEIAKFSFGKADAKGIKRVYDWAYAGYSYAHSPADAPPDDRRGAGPIGHDRGYRGFQLWICLCDGL